MPDDVMDRIQKAEYSVWTRWNGRWSSLEEWYLETRPYVTPGDVMVFRYPDGTIKGHRAKVVTDQTLITDEIVL